MNQVGQFGKSTWAKGGIALLAAAFSLLTAVIALGFGEAGPRSNEAAASIHPLTSQAATSVDDAAGATASFYGGGRLMAADPNGGYWTVSGIGAVVSHGGATAFGSPALSGILLSKPIVGMAATPDGKGYWLVASDGGIFTFGDAPFLGTPPSASSGVLGLIVTTATSSYTIVLNDGSDSAPTLTPTPTAGSAGTCNGAANPTPPTTSTYAGYSLQNAMTGPQIASDASQDGYHIYGATGPEVLAPGGWVEASHVVTTSNALEELGYTDPAYPGVTGAGLSINNDVVNSYGGYTFCFSLSGSNWQDVVVVLIAWPADNAQQEGEIDVVGGTPQGEGMYVEKVGDCNGASIPCSVVWQSTWPTSIETGVHEATVLWNPKTGDSFYLDGNLVATAAPSSAVGIPSTPHVPTMQIQDQEENASVPASSPLTASLYWIATYSYNQ